MKKTKKIKLTSKEFVKLCLECPKSRCAINGNGKCDRLEPYIEIKGDDKNEK